MKKIKIYVYAICKNEEKFVDTWVNSMSEADGIYVLDTGSTDNTVEKLRSLNVHVASEMIKPWRFDVARNKSMDLVPEDADICICTDLDEVLHAGWREKLEAVWDKNVSAYQYRYTWSFKENGEEGCVFWISKAHVRYGFAWKHPVHEILQYTGDKPYKAVEVPGMQLDHHPDNTKPRAQYLPLLELAVKENPTNDRDMHYLGREYMFYGMWKECEETLKKHLKLPGALWPEERCASMRYLARAAFHLGKENEELQWIFRAIAEAPHLREPWLEAADICSRKGEWIGALYFVEKALEIKERSRTYMNEPDSWGAKPYDTAAIAAYYAGNYEKARQYGKAALTYEPDNERLLKNMEYYIQK